MILVNGRRLPLTKFPDGSPQMLNLNDLFLDPEEVAFTLFWKFEALDEQIYLYNIVQHIRDNFPVVRMVLFMPYVPNARMDRQKDFIGEVHTLKYFCRFINDLNFDKVYVMDPHSDVTPTLLNHVAICNPDAYIKDTIRMFRPDVLFFPDNGAFKRYGAKDFGDIPRLYGEKVRDWKSGEILDYRIINPAHEKTQFTQNTRVLIIDDLCSYGGTFMAAASRLKQMGNPTVALYVTHCENSILKGNVLKPDSPISHVYTTDSHFSGEEHINMTVTPLLEEGDYE